MSDQVIVQRPKPLHHRPRDEMKLFLKEHEGTMNSLRILNIEMWLRPSSAMLTITLERKETMCTGADAVQHKSREGTKQAHAYTGVPVLSISKYRNTAANCMHCGPRKRHNLYPYLHAHATSKRFSKN